MRVLKSILIALAMLSAAFFVVAIPVSAVGANTIEGNVFFGPDPAGSYEIVYLYDVDMVYLSLAYTNSSGGFSFSGLADGDYYVSANHDEVTSPLISVSGDETRHQYLYLAERIYNEPTNEYVEWEEVDGNAPFADSSPLTVGDNWAMGFEIDLYNEFNPIIQELVGMLETMAGESGESADVTAGLEQGSNIGMFETFEVVSASPTYKIDYEVGVGFHIAAYFAGTGPLPAEGTYDDGVEAPEVQKEMKFSAKLDMATSVFGTMEFTPGTMTLESFTVGVKFGASGEFKLRNVPSNLLEGMMGGMVTGEQSSTPIYNDDTRSGEDPSHIGDEPSDSESTGTYTIVYEDHTFTFNANMEASFDFRMDPPLDIFQFPIGVDEKWIVEGTSFYFDGGSYSGSINAGGLPTELTDEMFSQMPEDITGFPINIASFPMPEQIRDNISNGNIEAITTPFDMPEQIMGLECIGTQDVTLGDGTTVKVHEIQSQSAGASDSSSTRGDSDGVKFLYSPDEGFVVGQDISGPMGQLDSVLGSTTSMMGITSTPDLSDPETLSLMPVSKAKADAYINENVDPLSPTTGGATLTHDPDAPQGFLEELLNGKSSLGLPISDMMLFLIVGLLMVVIILGVVMKKRGGSKNIAGGAPTQQPMQEEAYQEPYQEPGQDNYAQDGYQEPPQDPYYEQPPPPTQPVEEPYYEQPPPPQY